MRGGGSKPRPPPLPIRLITRRSLSGSSLRVGAGRLIEYGPTEKVFTNPEEQRTEDYITGRFG